MSIERDLKQEQVIHLDLSAYLMVERSTPVREVIARMREKRCGCVLVVDKGRLAGIFTERDVLCKCVDAPETWVRPVEQLMTPNPCVIRPEDRVSTALQFMNQGHYRNTPVVDAEGKVVGNLTHYAIIDFLCDRFPEGIYNLPPDPEQVARTRDGA
ncbi:MAG: CBS domain-containing protein [Armatimonadetes bacterium]|nr:CBS domain-containing protein [Armatimonadota bacterium]